MGSGVSIIGAVKQLVYTYQQQGVIVHQLVQECWGARVLRGQPGLNKSGAIVAFDEVLLEPCERFIKALAHLELPIRIPHLHVLVVVPQLVDARLCERHEQHVQRDTRDRVVFRLDVGVLPPRREPLRLALTPEELGGIRERF